MLFELDNVGYVYPEGTVGLRGLSVTIDEGERVAVLGSNGSGKSTLLRILDGLFIATSGSCRFRGTELTESALSEPGFQYEFRSKVGFVFQDADAQLFNPTVSDEVSFGPRQLGLTESEAIRRANDTMGFLGLGHLADRAPYRLSGGEKRKVAIASVLSMNPGVLMLDEPVAGLDPRMQSWLVNTLNQLQAVGKTTIVTTHNLDVLPKIADRAIVLSETHGLLADGPVTDVLRDNRLLLEANLIGEDQSRVALA